MSILQPDEIRSLRSVTVTSAYSWSKPDLHKVGKNIYELITHPRRPRGFKQSARKQTVELEPDKLFTPGEVSALLNVSYDTAVRRMLTMKKQSAKATLAEVVKEMAKPRVATSARE